MLQSLDPLILSALEHDGDTAGSHFVPWAKIMLNKDRNLSLGVMSLLETYPRFKAQLYQDNVPMYETVQGADRWHIRFRDPPFSDLCIYSTSVAGVIDVHVFDKPFLSIWIFDRPHNWQAMLKWLWGYGEEWQNTRLRSQLDPRRMSALINDHDRASGGDQMDTGGHTESVVKDSEDNLERFIRLAGKLVTDGTGEGMYKLLLAFKTFTPSLHCDTSSTCHPETRYEKWHITFLNSPFRSLRLQPGTLDGYIDIYAFKKRVSVFRLTNGIRNWYDFLEWLWDYGNKRRIAKAEYKASLLRSKATVKSQSKQKHAQKPLLHQVLRTAGFKAQRGPPNLKPKEPQSIVEEADITMIRVDDGMPTQRPALRPADPNGHIGMSGQTRSITVDHATKVPL